MNKIIAADIENFRQKRKDLLQPEVLIQDPLNFSLSYSRLLEELLEIAGSDEQSTAVLACGSFGRRELSPHSDINLFIIGREPRLLNEAMVRYRELMRKAGLYAHIFPVNTGEDISFLFNNSKYLTQIFEIRYICGNHKLWEDWQTGIVKSISTAGRKLELLHKILGNNEERHKKFGPAPGLVEPHVKLSAGGLRDLHVIEWLIALQSSDHIGVSPDRTKAALFNSIMLSLNIISPQYAEETLRAYSFVLGLRHVIHFAGNRRSDRLTYELQPKAAALYGFEKDGVAKLMNKYYTAAGFINRVSRSYMKYTQGAGSRLLPDALLEELDGNFRIRGEILELNDDSPITPETLFQGFYYRAERKTVLDLPVRYRFLEYIASGPKENDPGAIVYFKKIMQLPSNTGAAIRSLSEAGALELLIPEFAECKGYFTPTYRQTYTVDEHTIRSIETVEAFEESDLLPGRVLMGIENREPLYLALLFHDFAKPFGVQGHEIMGASIAETILDRLGYEEEMKELVSYLIKNHCLMPEYAFGSNPYNPLAAQELLPHIPSTQHLDLLFVLTYADLLSASPFIKTSWKEERLIHLYRGARLMLKGEPLDDGINIKEFPSPDSIFEEMNQGLTEEERRLGTIFMKETDIEGNRKTPALFASSVEEYKLRLSVITLDKPFLLSNLCAIFILNGFTIQAIRAFSKRENIIFDSFTLHKLKEQPVTQEMIEMLKNEIISLQNGFLSITDEMFNRYMKPGILDTLLSIGRQKPIITFTPKNTLTRLTITTPHRQGLVYFVANKLGELNFNIVLASVDIQNDEFRGEFYIRHRFGMTITANFYPIIETEINKVIQDLTS